MKRVSFPITAIVIGSFVVLLLVAGTSLLSHRNLKSHVQLGFLRDPGITSIDWRGDDENLAIGSLGNTVLYDWKTDKMDFLHGARASADYVKFSPDKSKLAGCATEVWVWDETNGVRTLAATSGYTRYTHIVWSPDGSMLVASSSGVRHDGNAIKLWDVNSGRLIENIPGDNANPADFGELGFSDVSWSPGGDLLLATAKGLNNVTRIWDPVDGRPSAKFQKINNSNGSVAFSPDGKLIAEVNSDQTIRLWSISSAQLVRNLPSQQRGITSLAWNFDSSELASISPQDESITVWDISSGKQLNVLNTEDAILAIEWSHTANKLISVGRSSIRLWNVVDGQYSVVEAGGETGYIAQWSPSDSLIAVVAGDGLHVYDAIPIN